MIDDWVTDTLPPAPGRYLAHAVVAGSDEYAAAWWDGKDWDQYDRLDVIEWTTLQ